ncbi:MAG TPA: hypothetical protein VLC91_02690 [Spongiibacteraceae bacterium]|nr:hypothetical protein [Spongiibacteraceae bacterium]
MIDKKYWLFKESRSAAGEDWSEKVAAEIGALLGISVADVELAETGRKGQPPLKFYFN